MPISTSISDKEIIEMNLRIGYQLEKIELLDSIIKSIMNRNFIIKNAIEWTKFTQGG
jgi:hypothetical protein